MTTHESIDLSHTHCVDKIRKALVAWLRWHAATRAEIAAVPDDCKPLFEAMSKASGVQAVARLAREIECNAGVAEMCKG